MPQCRSCGSQNPDTGRYCGSCGTPLALATPPSEVPTIAVPPRPTPVSPRGASPRPPSSGTSRISSEAVDEGRFPPGTLLADRYRIVGLVGRGGMGEVYRANDLKLGQPVALKFLPEGAARDERALARFLNEVRIALQVSHSNVCRVYDIGEFEGLTFLSMEYVDGEDLGSLLRRIGRFPPDRAIEIARQLCAGLAAAHEKGVLHRDLKPANIMINSRGEVRITDFGLAGLSGQVEGHEIRSGTPAYMAPEQLAGREVTIKSDLYALGLVLYEIFSGRRAFEANSLAELMRLQEQSTPVSLASLVRDLDPAVERVVLRCLDPDPRNRPSSALAVAAALPGGDPLAAALAAGETPSPDIVAAAGQTEGLSVRAATACMAAVVLLLLAITFLSNRVHMVNQVPFDSPPDVLAARARDLVQTWGYSATPEDSTFGFHYDEDFLQYLTEHRSDSRLHRLLTLGQPSLVAFWYRQSPRFLRTDSLETSGAVTMNVPPLTQSGELRLMLDPQGRLLFLEALPLQVEEGPASTHPADLKALLSAAGLDAARFTPTEPKWTPPMAFDQRAAWSGVYPGAPEIPLRVEAAAWRGHPVCFRVVAPWSRPEHMEQHHPPSEHAQQLAFLTVFLLLVAGACVLARRNWKLNRGDRRGAARLAAFTLCVNLAVKLCQASHVPEAAEFQTLARISGQSLLVAVLFWLAYMALEPYVRRRWPQTLISWSRVLSGKLRDPVVGGDVLLGVFFALIWGLLFATSVIVFEKLGTPPIDTSLQSLLGWRYIVANLLGHLSASIGMALFGFFFLFLLRIGLRKEWLAAAVFILLFAVTRAMRSDFPLVEAPFYALVFLLYVIFLLRFGLVPVIVASMVVDFLLMFPVTTNLSAWYIGPSLFALLIVIAIAGYGFHTSLAGRPLLPDRLLQD